MHPECRHIMPNGYKCRSAALRHSPYCYFHTCAHKLAQPGARSEKLTIKLPVLEDRSAIQLALVPILDGLLSGDIDIKKGNLMLYGLQIAAQTVERVDPILPRNTVKSITRTKDDQELAPKDLACDAPEDCANCDHRPICLKRRTMVGLYGGVEPLDEPTGNEDGQEEKEEDRVN